MNTTAAKYAKERAHLEAQWAHRRILSFGRNRIEMFDISPRRRKSAVPIVLVSGWGSTASILKENVLALAMQGRRVLYVNAPHGINASAKPGYPAAELRKVAALLLALDERRVRRVDVVAHSEGAIVAAIAAELAPARFRNLVLVNPAGLRAKTPVDKLAARFSADVLWGSLRRIVADPSVAGVVLKAWLETGKAVAADPFRSYEEAKAISSSDIAGLLSELRKREIGIAIIHAKGDRVFPYAQVCRRAGHDCVVTSVPGLHNEFYLKPSEFAKLIRNALDSLCSR